MWFRSWNYFSQLWTQDGSKNPNFPTQDDPAVSKSKLKQTCGSSSPSNPCLGNLKNFRREARAGHFISFVISSSVFHNIQTDFYCELLTCGVTPRKIGKKNKTQLTASAFNSHCTTLLTNLTSFMLFLSSQYWMKTHGGARTGLHLMVPVWVRPAFSECLLCVWQQTGSGDILPSTNPALKGFMQQYRSA